MNFKNIAKNAALVGAGFIVGVGVEVKTREVAGELQPDSSSNQDGDIWTGRTETWQYPIRAAEDLIGVCDYNIRKNWWENDIHYEGDIKTLRRKFSHALSDATDSGKEKVEVELTDRERLVMYHINPDIAMRASNAPIKEIQSRE